MGKPRKPIPKTQKQISVSKHVSFSGIEGRGALTNPNQAANPNYKNTGIEFNRSKELTLKGDTSKQFSVGIKDLDESIFYYFDNVIRPSVIQNGARRNVPVIYGAPERWKSFRKDGYYRDKGGAIMLPIIVIERNNLEKDRTVANKLDANQPNLYGTWNKGYNAKNIYSNFNILNNRKPVEQFNIVAQPDYVTLTYDCLIQTYYMEQLNKIIESVEYASDSYWGNPERYLFRAFIDNFSTATELTKGRDRLVVSTFSIRLRGYIIPEVLQKDLNAAKKYNSKAKVIVTNETVASISDLEKTNNPTSDGRKRN